MNIARLILLASLAAFPIVAPAGTHDDVSAAKQTIVDYYAAWAAHDIARYRSLCTSDYLILDNGKISNLAQDVAFYARIQRHGGDEPTILISGT